MKKLIILHALLELDRTVAKLTHGTGDDIIDERRAHRLTFMYEVVVMNCVEDVTCEPFVTRHVFTAFRPFNQKTQ